jgi:hypothetical protein
MTTDLDARSLLESLIGQQISTLTGRPNTILDLAAENVRVGTNRSPDGELIPIDGVQSALDRLLETGEIEVHPRSLGYRSSFVGAVLLTLPGAVALSTSPPRIQLVDPMTAYRANEAGHVNNWWADDPRQRFWLEITDRNDIGVDLHCPQRDAAGKRTPGYSLMRCVQVNDIVFHYDKNAHAIIGWSRAAGQLTEAPTVWLSHHAATRRRLRQERVQPGWWLDLDGPFLLNPPLALARIRASALQLRIVLEALRSDHPGSLYFPFSFYGGTEPRPQQPTSISSQWSSSRSSRPGHSGQASFTRGRRRRRPHDGAWHGIQRGPSQPIALRTATIHSRSSSCRTRSQGTFRHAKRASAGSAIGWHRAAIQPSP